MEARGFLAQGEIEPDSWKDCRYSVSFHHLAAVAVAFDVAVAQSVRVAVSAAAVGPAAVGHVPAAAS